MGFTASASQLIHLSRRFVGSLWPGPPAAVDESWARDLLLPGEQLIWARMNNPDKRHAVGVARAVAEEFDAPVSRPVLAAALLHDSGKVVSQLRTPARVLATVLWAVLDGDVARRWVDAADAADAADSPAARWRTRMGRYRLHPELGAELLAQAGADPLTVAWAREHHLAPERWTIQPEGAMVLKACDDD